MKARTTEMQDNATASDDDRKPVAKKFKCDAVKKNREQNNEKSTNMEQKN